MVRKSFRWSTTSNLFRDGLLTQSELSPSSCRAGRLCHVIPKSRAEKRTTPDKGEFHLFSIKRDDVAHANFSSHKEVVDDDDGIFHFRLSGDGRCGRDEQRENIGGRSE
jgi:hypothetical protein